MGLDHEKLARVKNEHFTPMTADEERAEKRERAARWCRVCGLDPARVALFSFADVRRTPIRRLTNGELSKHGYCETEAERDELEQALLEEWGCLVPVAWGRIALEQVRRKWNIVADFEVVGEMTAGDSEFVTMARALRTEPVRGAAYEVRGIGIRMSTNDLTAALALLEIVHQPATSPWESRLRVERTAVEARLPVLARQAHAWAQTRRVQAETLLGKGGLTGSAAQCEFVLNNFARRMMAA